MPVRRSTWRALPPRMPRASGARGKWWRRGRRAPRSTGCARRRLVLPDDADDHALHDHITLVYAQGLHGRIGGLQPDPAPWLTIKALHGSAVAMHQGNDGLAAVGLITLLHDDEVAVLDVLVDHRLAAHLEDVTAAAPRDELVWHGNGVVTGDRFDWLAGRHETEQGQFGGPGLSLGRDDLDGPALVMRPADVAFTLQISEVLMHRGERVEAELPGDLLEARGVPLGIEVTRDKVEDLALAARNRH